MRIRLTSILTVLPLMLSPDSWGADIAKGQEAYKSGDYQTAIAEWQPLAETGQAAGQFGMSLALLPGDRCAGFYSQLFLQQLRSNLHAWMYLMTDLLHIHQHN